MWPITILRNVLQLLVEKKNKLLIKIFKYEKYLQNVIPAAFNGLCLLYYANLHISYYLVLYVYFYSSYLLILFLLFLCCKVT